MPDYGGTSLVRKTHPTFLYSIKIYGKIAAFFVSQSLESDISTNNGVGIFNTIFCQWLIYTLGPWYLKQVNAYGAYAPPIDSSPGSIRLADNTSNICTSWIRIPFIATVS